MRPHNPLRGGLLTSGMSTGTTTANTITNTFAPSQQQATRKLVLKMKFKLAITVTHFCVRLRRIAKMSVKLTRHEIFMIRDVYSKTIRNAATSPTASGADHPAPADSASSATSAQSLKVTDPVVAISQLAEALGICDVSAEDAAYVIRRLRGRSQRAKSALSMAILETISSAIANAASFKETSANAVGSNKIHRTISVSTMMPGDINLASIIMSMASTANGGNVTEREGTTDQEQRKKVLPSLKPTGEIISEDLAVKAVGFLKQMAADKSREGGGENYFFQTTTSSSNKGNLTGKQNSSGNFSQRRLDIANQRLGLGALAGSANSMNAAATLVAPQMTTSEKRGSLYSASKALNGNKKSSSATPPPPQQQVIRGTLRPVSASGANATTAAEIQQQVHLTRKSTEAAQATSQLRGLFDMLVEESHKAHYGVNEANAGSSSPMRLLSSVTMRPKLPRLGESSTKSSGVLKCASSDAIHFNDHIAGIRSVQNLLDEFGLQLDAYSWALRTIPLGDLFPFGNYVSQRIKTLWDRLAEQKVANNGKRRQSSIAGPSQASAALNSSTLLNRSSLAALDELDASFIHGSNYYSLGSVDWLTPAMLEDIPPEIRKCTLTYEQLCGESAPLLEEAAAAYKHSHPSPRNNNNTPGGTVISSQLLPLDATVGSPNGYSSDNYGGEQSTTPAGGSTPAPNALIAVVSSAVGVASVGIRFSTYVPEKARQMIKNLSFDDAFITLPNFMALLEQLPTNAASTLTTTAQNALLAKTALAVENQQRNRRLNFGNDGQNNGAGGGAQHQNTIGGKTNFKANRHQSASLETTRTRGALVAEAADKNDEESFLDSHGLSNLPASPVTSLTSTNTAIAEQFQLHTLLRRGSNPTAASVAGARLPHGKRHSGGTTDSNSINRGSSAPLGKDYQQGRSVSNTLDSSSPLSEPYNRVNNDDVEEDDDQTHFRSQHSNHYSKKILQLSRKFSDPNLSSLGKRAQIAVQSLESMLDDGKDRGKANNSSLGHTKDSSSHTGNNINDEIDNNKSVASAQRRLLRHNQTLHSKEKGYNPALAGRSLWKLNDHSAFGLDARTGKAIITRKGALFEASLMGRFNGKRRRNKNLGRTNTGDENESDEDDDEAYFDAEGRPISRSSKTSNPHRNVQSVVAQYIAAAPAVNHSTNKFNKQDKSSMVSASPTIPTFSGNQFATVNGMIIPTTGVNNAHQARAQSACSNRSRPPLAHLVPAGGVSRSFGGHQPLTEQQSHNVYGIENSNVSNATVNTALQQPFRRPFTAGNTTSGSHRVGDLYLGDGGGHANRFTIEQSNYQTSGGGAASSVASLPKGDIRQLMDHRPQSGLARRLRRQLPTPTIESLSGAPSFILPQHQRARILNKHISSSVGLSSTGAPPIHSETMSVAGAVLGVLENHKYFHTRNVPLL